MRGMALVLLGAVISSLIFTGKASAAYGGSTTIGLYDPDAAVFYLRNSNTSGPADITLQYGNSGWKPLAGDWDGDGIVTPGVYDPTTGWFYLRNSNTSGPADTSFQYGNIGWTPMAGDWNGNGYWSVGMYDPVDSTYYLRDTNSPGAADYVANFGNGDSGWQPLSGDWDSDRATTIGIYRPDSAGCMECGFFWYLRNTNSTGPSDVTFDAGSDFLPIVPLAGDWNGNGYWSTGTYNSNDSTFYLFDRNSFHVTSTADVRVQYGNSGWVPLSGDWDGR